MAVKVTAEYELDGFEDVLKQARKGSGRTTTDIAAAVGISTAHLYAVEGGSAVSLLVLRKWCEVLGVEMPVLEGDRDEK